MKKREIGQVALAMMTDGNGGDIKVVVKYLEALLRKNYELPADYTFEDATKMLIKLLER